MKWMLIVLLVSSKNEAVTTEMFSDKKSCLDAGKATVEFVKENDGRWGDASEQLIIVLGDKLTNNFVV